MKTVTLQIDDEVDEKFFWLLKHFSQDEVKIIEQSDTAKEAGQSEDQSKDTYRAEGKQQVEMPITRSLIGVMDQADVDEEDYKRHLEEKYR